ncbi:uncharacterized protein LOC113366173 isoform X1 [Ctenocephalides felis]|uniref:uncharacterized protein LOC113366173 isoform X1 n=1 Tax=Ctenocephalides felis TaxID=7515 RepID=UPI000E6E166C|nr:uncharacterized protein LOC113366173 isoform X1 [Ctenocephalides felis]
MTLTHIAKLSEIEFLNKKNEKDAEVEVEETKIDGAPANDDDAPANGDDAPAKSDDAPVHKDVDALLEVAKPDQVDEVILPPPTQIQHLPPNPDPTPDMNNRKALSVEEALFFECCSLLKSSEATKNEIASETQKFNPNLYAMDNLKLLTNNHHYSNKFSDISNDSNNVPAVPNIQEDRGGNLTAFLATVDKFISAPLLNHHQRDDFARSDGDGEFLPSQDQVLRYNNDYQRKNFSPISSTHSDVVDDNLYIKSNVLPTDSYSNDTVSKDFDANLYNENNMIVHSNLNSYSETGDSTPPSLVNTDDENSLDNCVENTSVFGEIEKNVYGDEKGDDQGAHGDKIRETDTVLNGILDSDLSDCHSDLDLPPSIQSSPNSDKKIPTKGALKVFESLKVSIPTSEINLEKVINACSNSSKLAAFAEIALHREHSNHSRDLELDKLSPPIEMNMSDDNLVIDERPITPGRGLLDDFEEPVQEEVVVKPKDVVITNPRKNNVALTFGNKLGFRIKKKRVQRKTVKKPVGNRKTRKNNSKPKEVKNVIKDVYDFDDDSLENIDLGVDKLKGYASSKTVGKPETNIIPDEPPPPVIEAINLENSIPNSLQTSQPSDDDVFDYLSDNMSDVSSAESTATVKTKLDIEEKPKRLIVGKIFRKNLKDKPEKPNVDELFDALLSETDKEKEKVEQIVETNDKVALENAVELNHVDVDVDVKPEQEVVSPVKNNKKKNHRSKSIIEQELGMSFQQIKEIIGFATRKSQRKCTTGKQNVLAENWSSDEDLDTRLKKEKNRSDRKSTKENIEHKSPRGRKSDPVIVKKNANDVVGKPLEEKPVTTQETTETPVNGVDTKISDDKEQCVVNGDMNEDKTKKLVNGTGTTPKNKRTYRRRPKNDNFSSDSETDTVKKRARKMRKKRKSFTKTSRDHSLTLDSATEPLPEIVEKLTTDLNVEKIAAANKKRNKQNLTDLDAQTAAILSLPRRKRVSTDMLYYWSSSSDEDQYAGMIEVKPIRDDVNLSEHPIQHGWIVGDSHKKLVTLLAHAKGKKTEDCAVKEGHIKKNRSTL